MPFSREANSYTRRGRYCVSCVRWWTTYVGPVGRTDTTCKLYSRDVVHDTGTPEQQPCVHQRGPRRRRLCTNDPVRSRRIRVRTPNVAFARSRSLVPLTSGRVSCGRPRSVRVTDRTGDRIQSRTVEVKTSSAKVQSCTRRGRRFRNIPACACTRTRWRV